MKPRFDSADWYLKAGGHSIEWQVGPIVEDDDQPFVEWQDRHVPQDVVASKDVREWIGLVGSESLVERQEPDHLSSPNPIAADIDEDAIQPGWEPFYVTKPVQRAPCDQQRILDGILGVLGIAQDQAGQSVAAI
jgi:hypothetical protein